MAAKKKRDKNSISVSTYDKIAGKYTQQYFDDLSDSPYVDQLLKYLPKKGRILDAGCGPGTFTKYLAEKGYDVVGIDLSKEMLKIAKEKFPSGTFTTMDIRNLTFKNGEFDGILAAYSLIHIPTDELPGTLEGFWTILKPGGAVLVIAQKGPPDRIMAEPFKKEEKTFVNFFTKNRLTDLLEDAGFEIQYLSEKKTNDQDSMSDSVIYTIATKPSDSALE